MRLDPLQWSRVEASERQSSPPWVPREGLSSFLQSWLSPWTSGDPLREGQEPWTVVPSSVHGDHARRETEQMTQSELLLGQASAA